MMQSELDINGDDSSGEIMLFGVRVKIDPMRKCVSMNNLSQYQHPAMRVSSNNNNNKFDISKVVAAVANTGYASADDVVRNRSNGHTERKRGKPWTEDEHKLFLLGLEKVGKGDWRGISRNFVKTRTPTQVASHAQKYFLRHCNISRRRRRSSLFDITTDSVAVMPTEQVKVNNKDQDVVQPSMPSAEMMTFNNDNQLINGGSMVVPRPLIAIPTPNPLDLNQNQKYGSDQFSVSLDLSLSFNPNQSSSYESYQAISGKNGDGMISVN